MRHLLLLFLLASIVASAPAQLLLVVDELPASTPADASIYIAGDFQGWQPGESVYRLQQNADLGGLTITLPAGTGEILFKFTRGDWSMVEGNSSGRPIANRYQAATAGPDTVYVQIAGWEDLDGPGGNPSTAAANVSILSEDFYMSTLDRNRRIWLYLPPDYEQSDKRYPVLYMHDGQNVFDANTSFSGEWEVDETLNALHAAGDRGIIVVAIDNGGILRSREYSVWENERYPSGEGAAYIDFIVQDLKPYVDNNYRTLPGREHTGIMGSSLGGLISLYAGIRYQAVFSKIGAISPAYWFNPETFDYVETTGKDQNMRIYQIAGTQEGQQYVEDMLAMQEQLFAAGFENVSTTEHPDGQHSEWYWAREFGAAYQWMFEERTTSTEDSIVPITEFKLFPNPARDSVRLRFELLQAATVGVDLIDTKGAVLQSISARPFAAGPFQLNLELDRAQLPAGNYFCRLVVDGKTVSQPLRINH